MVKNILGSALAGRCASWSVLAKDVEDRSREVGIFTILNKLTKNTEAHVFAFRKLRSNRDENQISAIRRIKKR